MFGFCDDERDHRERAENDARRYRHDYEYYDRYSSDPCKQAYTEAYDREQREMYREEEQQRVAREEQEMEDARVERRRQQEREFEEQQLADYQLNEWGSTIERMLADGHSWNEIGEAIGWCPETAKEWYDRFEKPERSTLQEKESTS